jgi:hypothetical protein
MEHNRGIYHRLIRVSFGDFVIVYIYIYIYICTGLDGYDGKILVLLSGAHREVEGAVITHSKEEQLYRHLFEKLNRTGV